MAYRDDEYINKLISGLVHDIRNPLHGITTCVAALSCLVEDRPDAQPFFKMIMDDVSRLNTLMARTQEIYQNVLVEGTSQQVSAVIHDALMQVQDLAQSRESSVILQDNAGQLQLLCDGHRLSRAFAALIENAIESGQGVRVEICTRQAEDREIVVTITDNGDGIRTEDLPRVLDPFFTTRRGKSGLGATIAERIIREHKGHIVIAAEEGKGTRVQVTLPLGV